MLSGRDIICVSSIDWDFIWQGHQEIMSTLARQGNRVLFIENTGVRSPTFRDLPRLRRRIWNWWHSTQGFREERPGLFIYSPILLPFPYWRAARWINRRLMLGAMGRWMRAVGFRRPILWTFLPTPLTLDLIRALEPSLTVYYCIDDLAASSRQAQKIVRSESQLFRTADLVFVTSERLRERAVRFRPEAHLFPFGVSLEAFERVRRSADGVPEELARLPRPVIGYVGGLHQWVDFELVGRLAAGLPQASVVMVGPAQADVTALAKHPNVHLLGKREHADLPRYIRSFDVGIIPYRLSRYTEHVYPTKLNEYLAMGVPVVATNLPEIRRFNREYGDIVDAADGPVRFVEAVRRAAGASTPADVQRRIAVATDNSWQARIAKMSAMMLAALEVRKAADESWQESLRRAYRTARRRMAQLVAGALAAYFLVFHTGLMWWAASPLTVRTATQPADAVVVFAGGVGESGKAGGGGGYQERVKQAVDLYQAGLAPRMIFSSGYTHVFHETEVMKSLAVSLGVPPGAILLETQAVNTRGNVEQVGAMLGERGWRRILLVSSPYHMRRAVGTFRKLAPEIEVSAVPVPRSQFYAHGTGISFEQLKALIREYVAIIYYWWRGWL